MQQLQFATLYSELHRTCLVEVSSGVKLFGPLHSEKLTFAAGYPKQVLQTATPSVSFAFTTQLRKIPLLSAKP